MKSVSPAAVRDVLLLSLAAGSADAVAYLGFDRVFTSNMTGNVVLLGVFLGQGDFALMGRAVFVLAAFVTGVALGIGLTRDPARQTWPMLARRLINLEKAALVIFSLGWAFFPDRSAHRVEFPLLGLLAVAMGMQTAALNRLNAPGVGTTAITGTITALVNGVAQWWDHRKGSLATADSPSARIGFQAGVLLLYCLGAATSGLLILRLPWLAGCWPTAIVLLTSWGRRT